ncbi:MAG: hypothetical protein U5M50_04230 [Sphingobium sp.]|nr:hypothetical protein [Sphingobium sp.]
MSQADEASNIGVGDRASGKNDGATGAAILTLFDPYCVLDRLQIVGGYLDTLAKVVMDAMQELRDDAATGGSVVLHNAPKTAHRVECLMAMAAEYSSEIVALSGKEYAGLRGMGVRARGRRA